MEEIFRIVVVDDDDRFRGLYERTLRPHNVKIETDSKKAVDIIIQENPDAVVSDTNMGYGAMQGYEMMDTVRERGYQGPFVGVSVKEGYRAQWEKRGVYFTKKEFDGSIKLLVEKAIREYKAQTT